MKERELLEKVQMWVNVIQFLLIFSVFKARIKMYNEVQNIQK